LYSIKQILLTKWLGQELNRTSLHSLHRHGDVAVSSDEDYWEVDVCSGELALKVETALSGNLMSSTRQAGVFGYSELRKSGIEANSCTFNPTDR
jgi:hypothetical protein